MQNLRPSKASNLAVSPDIYNKQNMDQFKNQLRLYFTELDSNNQQLIQATNNLSVMSWLGDLL